MVLPILRTTALVLSTALPLISCDQAPTPKKVIVGKWKATKGKEVLEFFSDGTVSTSGRDGNFAGKFSFPDESHIKLEMGGLAALAGPMVGSYSVSSDTLK